MTATSQRSAFFVPDASRHRIGQSHQWLAESAHPQRTEQDSWRIWIISLGSTLLLGGGLLSTLGFNAALLLGCRNKRAETTRARRFEQGFHWLTSLVVESSKLSANLSLPRTTVTVFGFWL